MKGVCWFVLKWAHPSIGQTSKEHQSQTSAGPNLWGLPQKAAVKETTVNTPLKTQHQRERRVGLQIRQGSERTTSKTTPSPRPPPPPPPPPPPSSPRQSKGCQMNGKRLFAVCRSGRGTGAGCWPPPLCVLCRRGGGGSPEGTEWVSPSAAQPRQIKHKTSIGPWCDYGINLETALLS